ncbi:MAG: purine-cytosine permease family protein [Gammaproteobacteria bacterium]
MHAQTQKPEKPLQQALCPPLAGGLERRGIERVLPHERNHFNLFDNFTLWLSANLVISTVALGALAIPVFHQGFWGGCADIVIFTAFGTLPVAFFATLGPKLGLRQMTISRFSFGWNGAKIMALFNVWACIGWSAVSALIAAQILTALSGGRLPISFGVLVIATLTTGVSIYGYRYVHRYERYAWLPMAAIFLILTLTTLPEMRITPAISNGPEALAGWVSFGGVVFGAAIGWSSYAADYTVNQPEQTPRSRVFWFTFGGIFLPCVLLELLGMGLTTAGFPLPAHQNGGGTLVALALRPLGNPGALLLVVLALGMVANNIPNDYSLGLSMQVLGRRFHRVSRTVWTLLGALCYVTIDLLAAHHFDALLANFLLIVAYWLGPWSIILILEHFWIRRGVYLADQWDTPSALPQGWAALGAMGAGFLGVYLGAAQALFVGPLAEWLSPPKGMDVGFELGVLLAALAYLILRPWERRRIGR